MNRRERLRAETIAEITAIALRQMSVGSPGAVSLRAIAREMEMTPRAIYSYFKTRDDLITALIEDTVIALAAAVEAARDAVSLENAGGRILAWGEGLREWAINHPERFRLLYGDSVPGYQRPEEGPVSDAARRICGGLTELVAAVWPIAQTVQPNDLGWDALPADYAAKVQADIPGLSPGAAILALRVWGRMHGLVALEVDGHLKPVCTDPAALYRAEMLDLVRSLGLSSAEL